MTGIQLFAGDHGTPSLPKGATIRRIVVVGGSGATVAMPDGNGGTATVPAPAAVPHVIYEAAAQSDRSPALRSAGDDVTFTSTTSYVVEMHLP